MLMTSALRFAPGIIPVSLRGGLFLRFPRAKRHYHITPLSLVWLIIRSTEDWDWARAISGLQYTTLSTRTEEPSSGVWICIFCILLWIFFFSLNPAILRLRERVLFTVGLLICSFCSVCLAEARFGIKILHDRCLARAKAYLVYISAPLGTRLVIGLLESCEAIFLARGYRTRH